MEAGGRAGIIAWPYVPVKGLDEGYSKGAVASTPAPASGPHPCTKRTRALRPGSAVLRLQSGANLCTVP